MADVLTQRRFKQIKQRSNSLKTMKHSKQLKNVDNLSTNNKYNEAKVSTIKPHKESDKTQDDLKHNKTNSKNLNQQSQYIKTLYKKYLGKQNQVQSDKKSKVQMKFNKNLFQKDDYKDYNKSSIKNIDQVSVVVKNNYTQENDYHNQRNKLEREYSQEKRMTKQKQKQKQNKRKITNDRNEEIAKQNTSIEVRYKTMLNEDMLQMIGNPRSSMVHCLKSICHIKKLLK